jgi:hypothetical protein
MAVTVKKAVIWRRDITNQPGTFASSLRPFAEGKIDLQVVMGYVIPGQNKHAAIEVFPVTSGKAEKAARQAGMKPGNLACLIVEGDNHAGIGYAIGDALSKAAVNMNFAVMQAVGRKYIGVFGFDSITDAVKATPLIKAAASGKGAKKSGKKSGAKVVKLVSKKAKKGKKSGQKAAMRKTSPKKKSSAKSKKTSKRK